MMPAAGVPLGVEGGGVMNVAAPDRLIRQLGMPSEVFGITTTRMHKIEVEDQASVITLSTALWATCLLNL